MTSLPCKFDPAPSHHRAVGHKKIQIHYVAGVADIAPIMDELEAR